MFKNTPLQQNVNVCLVWVLISSSFTARVAQNNWTNHSKCSKDSWWWPRGGRVNEVWDEMERRERNSPVESRLLALVLLPNTESKSTLRLWAFWGCWGVGEAVNPDDRENNQPLGSRKTAATLHMVSRDTLWWREMVAILFNMYVEANDHGNFKLHSILSFTYIIYSCQI